MRGGRGYHTRSLGRRDLLLGLGAAAVTGCGRARSSCEFRRGPPEAPWGVQTGDVGASRAVVWSRVDRSSRLVVEWSTSERFEDARRVEGPLASADDDLCAKVALEGLPAGTRIHTRTRFEGEDGASEWAAASFATAPIDARDVVFAWSGDTNGQGWGIDRARGGMPAYAAVLDRRPELFVHCGDRIYADNPIPTELAQGDGTVWRNETTEAKAHVAETLDDFRGAFLYSRLCAEVRALSAAAPLVATWDDHEVRDNWFPGQIHRDERYRERRVDVLTARARRAMLEHTPILLDAGAPLYRSVRWGPLLELFVVDGRSYRTPNYPRPPSPSGAEAFFGEAQRAWLERAVAASAATWKVVVCQQPLGLFLEDRTPEGTYEPEAVGNQDGPPSGREIELARLLAAWKERSVRNVVWLTADVHYAAAHFYDPAKAQFRGFDPFWEFVAGPMHAAAFGRKRPDDTFGIDVAYASMEPGARGSPATGQQFFGVVRIDGRTRALGVTLVDMRGRDLYATTLRAT